MLITAAKDANVADIKAFFKKEGFSELWAPARVMYMEDPPVMGTGKFNYVLATQLAQEANA